MNAEFKYGVISPCDLEILSATEEGLSVVFLCAELTYLREHWKPEPIRNNQDLALQIADRAYDDDWTKKQLKDYLKNVCLEKLGRDTTNNIYSVVVELQAKWGQQ